MAKVFTRHMVAETRFSRAEALVFAYTEPCSGLLHAALSRCGTGTGGEAQTAYNTRVYVDVIIHIQYTGRGHARFFMLALSLRPGAPLWSAAGGQ